MTERSPTSVVLDGLLGVLIFLAILALLPGVSAFAGLLLIVPAFQMIKAHPGPVFPRRIAARQIKTRRLGHMIRRIVPVLSYLERVIHPRWLTPFEATKRVVGGTVLLLGVSLLAPIPLSNVPLALLIVLIAFAYLEEDGLLLCVALVAVVIFLMAAAVAIWQTMSATGII